MRRNGVEIGNSGLLWERAMKTKALQICLYVLVLVVSADAADPKRYLFVWAGDADKKASDFLAAFAIALVMTVPLVLLGLFRFVRIAWHLRKA